MHIRIKKVRYLIVLWKTYDSVWREGLFYKLIQYGCRKNFVRILLSMYSSVRVAVKLNAEVTPFFTFMQYWAKTRV